MQPVIPDVSDLQGEMPLGILRRNDGGIKGRGYLGPLNTPGGQVATEYSVGVNLGGKEQDIPSLVPNLSRPEIEGILSGNLTDEIIRKAVFHAQQRMRMGMNPFAQ